MNKTIGRETVFEVAGKKYTLARYDRDVLLRLIDFVRKVTPDPLDVVRDKLKGFPEAIQHRLIDKAMEKASIPIGYGSPQFNAVMSTLEGANHLFYLLLQKHHPLITEKEAMTLYDESVKEHGFGYIEGLMTKAAGEIPIAQDDIKRETLQEFGLIGVEEKKG